MAASAAEKSMQLRREVRDLEQKAEQLEEQAKAKLTIEEAAARFSSEAAAIRQQIVVQKLRITTLDESRQTRLF